MRDQGLIACLLGKGLMDETDHPIKSAGSVHRGKHREPCRVNAARLWGVWTKAVTLGSAALVVLVLLAGAPVVWAADAGTVKETIDIELPPEGGIILQGDLEFSSVAGEADLYHLRITFKPVITEAFSRTGGNYTGDGVFPVFDAPGNITLAVEDYSARFAGSPILYFKETSSIYEDTARPASHYADKSDRPQFGTKSEELPPNVIVQFLDAIKAKDVASFLIGLPARIGPVYSAIQLVTAFKGEEAVEFGFATDRPAIGSGVPVVHRTKGHQHFDRAKEPLAVFGDDLNFDIQLLSWKDLEPSTGRPYELNALFTIKRLRPNETFLYIRTVLRYARLKGLGYTARLVKYDIWKRHMEIEWLVKLPQVASVTADRYKLIPRWATWEEAKSDCEARGGHLATITTAAENELVEQSIGGLGYRTAWIGLHDVGKTASARAWQWVSGESAAFVNWHSGEPGAGGKELHVEMYGEDGTWNDVGTPGAAAVYLPYVCEFEGDGGVPSPAEASVVRWASQVDSAVEVKNEASAAGKPDGKMAGSVTANSTLRLFKFTEAADYDLDALAKFLGASSALLLRADFIAFEHNGSPHTPFESSTWVFDDGSRTITVEHDFKNPKTTRHIIHYGNVTPRQYADFFKVSDRRTGCYAFLLFDIDEEIDTDSPAFNVTLRSRSADPGTPDPDAMGVVGFD